LVGVDEGNGVEHKGPELGGELAMLEEVDERFAIVDERLVGRRRWRRRWGRG
jgi:hypothetical protein